MFDEGITEMDRAEHLVCYQMEVVEDGTRIRFTPTSGGISRRVWVRR